jgi:hypothetical protein
LCLVAAEPQRRPCGKVACMKVLAANSSYIDAL